VESFIQTLEKYGADLAAVRSFDTDAPELLPYATLLAARKVNDSVLAALTGVYEWQNNPLVFLVEADKLASDQGLDRIRRLVAMRGDAPYWESFAQGSSRCTGFRWTMIRRTEPSFISTFRLVRSEPPSRT